MRELRISMSKNKNNAGRKTVYSPDFPERAERYCARYSFLDKDLAEELGVTEKTINDWKRKYPKFRNAIKKGKSLNSSEIEHNLRQLAHPHDEVTELQELRGRGKNRKLVTTGRRIKKGVVSEGAATRVLMASDPRYKNKGEMDIKGDGLKQLLEEIGKSNDSLLPDKK